MLLTPNTLSASILEVQNSNAVADFPAALHLGADLDDLACRFMRRDHRQTRRKLPLQDLKIRVAESSCIHLHKEVVLATNRNRPLAELIRLIELSNVRTDFLLRQ